MAPCETPLSENTSISKFLIFISSCITNFYFNFPIQYSNKTNDFDTLKISSESGVDSNKNKTVIARIIGVIFVLIFALKYHKKDLQATESLPTFDDSYLLQPTSPQTNTRVQEVYWGIFVHQLINFKGTSAWMFIEKDAFTLSSLECDKIGVGYIAFANQNSREKFPQSLTS